MFKKLSFTLATLATLSACSGTSSDPKTLVKGDLNPPFNLTSITYQDGFILQWDISNTEKDLTGYNVYVAKTSLADLQTALKGSVASKKIDKQQIRRCLDTADLFAKFGFKADDKFAKKDCDNFSEEETPAAASPTANQVQVDGSLLAEDAPAATPNLMKCKTMDGVDMSNGNLFSVDVSKAIDVNKEKLSSDLKQRVGKSIRCLLAKDDTLSDGSKGFSYGTKYSAFVVAVKGSKAESISYTSNFIEDFPTPVQTLDFALGESKASFVKIQDSGSGDLQWTQNTTITKADNAADCDTATTSQCKIGRNYVVPVEANFGKLAIVEDVQTNSNRVFFVGQQNKVFLTPVNPRPNKVNGQDAIYAPGDIAPVLEENETYFSGKNFELYPGSMFYYAMKRSSTEVFYGKAYLSSVELQGETKNIKLIMTLQTKANELFSSMMKAAPWMLQNN